MIIDLTEKELELVRTALRNNEESYKRANLGALVTASSELRNKISNTIIDFALAERTATSRTSS